MEREQMPDRRTGSGNFVLNHDITLTTLIFFLRYPPSPVFIEYKLIQSALYFFPTCPLPSLPTTTGIRGLQLSNPLF
jgi:hypothetical protein